MSGEGAYLGAAAPQEREDAKGAKPLMGADIALLVHALRRIACFDDVIASARLAQTGSYSAFDEPGSVQIARETLSAFASLREAK